LFTRLESIGVGRDQSIDNCREASSAFNNNLNEKNEKERRKTNILVIVTNKQPNKTELIV
jgi:hypothetical protein